jgi:Flp pilus assembly protein TadD
VNCQSLLVPLLVLLGACGDGEPAGTGSGVPQAAANRLPGVRAGAAPPSPELREVARALGERRWERARELAQAHLVKHPRDGYALFYLGMSHYRTDNFGAARFWLEQALAAAPEIEILHDYLGYCLFMLGELDGARRHFTTYAALYPQEPRAEYVLGLIELEESRLDAAAERFRRALALFAELGRSDPRAFAGRQPELAECHARLADVHFAREEYAAARDELVTATTLCPANISAFFTLSQVYRRLGEERLADETSARYEAARRALVAGQARQ